MSQKQPDSYHSLIAGLSLDSSEESASDLAVLTHLANVVAGVTADIARQPEVIYPFFIYREASYHAYHRIVIYAHSSSDKQDVSFVGFVSRRRAQLDPEIVQQVSDIDKTLVMELAVHGNLLNYSSMQLHDGNWFNLVQFARPDGKEAVPATKTHQYAAYELAPRYYRWIRLHHGLIPRGDPANGLQLHSTKYYTFHASTPRPDIRVHHYQQDLVMQP
ncbi:MAG TPA: hypothetical protein VGN34_27595 [Ktedonobacteraceae bacterium]|jgi:hypothetical protein